MAGSSPSEVEAEVPVSRSDSGTRRGGWITFPFMICGFLSLIFFFFGSDAVDIVESSFRRFGRLYFFFPSLLYLIDIPCLSLCAGIASWGWLQNLIVFLINEFNMQRIAAAKVNNIVNGCVSLFPVIGAIIADSLFGTIHVILAFSSIPLLGTVLLNLIVSFDSLRPPSCKTTSNLCDSPSNLQFGILYTAISLAVVGPGFTLATAGANQYDKPKDQGSFFNWYFFTIYLSAVVGATAFVYIEDNVSWRLGFGLCLAVGLFGFIIFLLGKRFYRHDKPQGSPFTGLIRVVVAAIRKRKVVVSPNLKYYHHEYHEEAQITTTMPANNFRFLNRASLIIEGDIKPDGSVHNPWRLCSIEQVEDLKAIIRLLPLVLATIFLNTPTGVLQSIIVLQALVMDRQISQHFKVPAGSIIVLAQTSTCIFLTLNDRFIYPLYRKLTHKSLTPLQRVGIGHVFNVLTMAIAAIVEAKRLKLVKNRDLLRSSSSVVPMSVLWLLPQLVLVGVGEAFYLPGNVALCYQEFPISLKSTATSVTSLVIGVCFYLSAALINLVQDTTAWLPNDINHGRVDNVYWVLVIGGLLNFGYFLICAWFYKYRN